MPYKKDVILSKNSKPLSVFTPEMNINNSIDNYQELYNILQTKMYKRIQAIVSENKFNLNQSFIDGLEPLNIAIQMTDLYMVKLLLQSPTINVNHYNEQLKVTPLLHMLISYTLLTYNKLERLIILEFLNHQANVNQCDELHMTPITYAMTFDNVEFLKILLPFNNSIDEKNKNCICNPLLHKIIIIYNEMYVKGINKRLPMDKECLRLCETFTILLDSHIDPEIKNDIGLTPIQSAIHLQDWNLMLILLNYGVIFQCTDYYVIKLFRTIILEENYALIALCLYHLIKRNLRLVNDVEWNNIPYCYLLKAYQYEIHKMQNHYIGHKAQFTYFDILFKMSVNTLAYYCHINDMAADKHIKYGLRLNDIYDRNDYNNIKVNYPLFGTIILNRIQKGRIRNMHYDLAYEYIKTKIPRGMEQLSVTEYRLIIGLFKNKEIRNFRPISQHIDIYK